MQSRTASLPDLSTFSRPTALTALLVGALCFMPFNFAVGAIAGLFGGVLLIARPRVAFYLLVLSVPIQDAVSVGGSITVTQLTFVATVGAWLLWRMANREQVTLKTPIMGAYLLFLAAISVSVFSTHSLLLSLAEISRWSVTILAYLLAINLIRTRQQMNILIAVLLANCTMEALLGVGQSFLRAGPLSFLVSNSVFRAYGTIGAPNSYAGYIDHALPLAITLAIYWLAVWLRRQRAVLLAEAAPYPQAAAVWRQLQSGLRRSFVLGALLSVAAGLMAFAVILSLSRGAWVGLSLGLLAMVVALGKRATGPLVVFGVAVVFFLIALGSGALPAELADRIQSITDNVRIFDPHGIRPTPESFAIVERMAQWWAGWAMYQANPLTGVGIGNYSFVYTQFNVAGWNISPGHAHNYYLHIAAEAGLVGFIAYIGLLLTILWQAIRAVRATRQHGYYQAISIGALGILVTFMGHNFFENLHVLNMGIQWSSVLALFYLVRVLPSEGPSLEGEAGGSKAEAGAESGWGFGQRELARTEVSR